MRGLENPVQHSRIRTEDHLFILSKRYSEPLLTETEMEHKDLQFNDLTSAIKSKIKTTYTCESVSQSDGRQHFTHAPIGFTESQ